MWALARASIGAGACYLLEKPGKVDTLRNLYQFAILRSTIEVAAPTPSSCFIPRYPSSSPVPAKARVDWKQLKPLLSSAVQEIDEKGLGILSQFN